MEKCTDKKRYPLCSGDGVFAHAWHAVYTHCSSCLCTLFFVLYCVSNSDSCMLFHLVFLGSGVCWLPLQTLLGPRYWVQVCHKCCFIWLYTHSSYWNLWQDSQWILVPNNKWDSLSVVPLALREGPVLFVEVVSFPHVCSVFVCVYKCMYMYMYSTCHHVGNHVMERRCGLWDGWLQCTIYSLPFSPISAMHSVFSVRMIQNFKTNLSSIHICVWYDRLIVFV